MYQSMHLIAYGYIYFLWRIDLRSPKGIKRYFLSAKYDLLHSVCRNSPAVMHGALTYRSFLDSISILIIIPK